MRMSDLARESGVSVSTIKFYLREELLPPGVVGEPNQAEYGDLHLRRLALIRALREVAGLPLQVIRDVLRQTERPWADADPVGRALAAVYPVPPRDRTPSEERDLASVRREVERVLMQLEWVQSDTLRPQHLHLDYLADALMQVRKHIDPAYPIDRLAEFAHHIWQLSEAAHRGYEERTPQPGDDLAGATRDGLLGILLIEPVVGSLLRTALVLRSLKISAEREDPPSDAKARS